MSGFSQNADTVKYIFPTQNGDIECVILTKDGYDNLMSEIKDLRDKVNNGNGNNGNGNNSNGNRNELFDNQNPDIESLKIIYPNKTAIRKMNEKEVVELGKELKIKGVDINLRAKENDTIVISWFESNIWK